MPDDAPTADLHLRAARPARLVDHLAEAARLRLYRDFLALMAPKPGEPILDVGVADLASRQANFLEALHPRRSDITCAGFGDGTAVRRAYPGVGYAMIRARDRLPFADKSFAIATCNAMLQHVGSDADRRLFLREMVRVAERVFVSVPNRWFPVEHHAGLPLLHYFPPGFYDYCASTRREGWSDPEHLRFLSRASFMRLWPIAADVRVIFSGLTAGPLSSHLVGAWGTGPALRFGFRR